MGFPPPWEPSLYQKLPAPPPLWKKAEKIVSQKARAGRGTKEIDQDPQSRKRNRENGEKK
jgi:hypothetical protein